MSEQSLRDRLGPPVAPEPPQHDDVATWRAATRDDIDALHALIAAADAVDHPTWITPREEIADSFDLSHIDHERDSIVAFDAAGEAVAFGVAALHPSRTGMLMAYLSGTVRPDLRRRGIGTQVLAWSVARARQHLAEVAPELDQGEWPAELRIFAEETMPDAVTIAERLGFATERWFTSMVRDMTLPVPELAEPPGIRVAEFSHDRDEAARIARNDAFRDHWGSLPTTPESWAKFVGSEYFRPELGRLAIDDDGAIAAFCLATVNEDDWAAMGASNAYIDLIGVVRAHRREGLAPLVISRTLAAIAAAGLEKAVLDVDTASPTGANTLYERLGFVATERHLALVAHL